MNMWVKPVLTVLSLCLLCGCSTGTKISQADLDAFRPGQTREADVIAKLGPPTSRTDTIGGESVLSYHYARSSDGVKSAIPAAGALAGGIAGSLAGLLGGVAGSMAGDPAAQTQDVALTFQADGTLKSITRTSS